MKQRKTIHLIKEVSQGKTRPFLIKSGSAWIDNLLPKAISSCQISLFWLKTQPDIILTAVSCHSELMHCG